MRVDIYITVFNSTNWTYTLYTSTSCKGFKYNGEYKSLGTCKEAVRRLGVRLGQDIKIEVIK